MSRRENKKTIIIWVGFVVGGWVGGFGWVELFGFRW